MVVHKKNSPHSARVMVLQKNVPVKGQIDGEIQALDDPARRSEYLG